jgi:hypothetical protein
MNKLIAVLILSLSCMATVVHAEHGDRDGRGDRDDRDEHKGPTFAAPEIDPSSAIGALTLLLGSVVVLRSRVATKR